MGMRWYGAKGEGRRHAVTICFMTLAMAQVFHAFNARSQTKSAFTARLFANGWLRGATLNLHPAAACRRLRAVPAGCPAHLVAHCG